MRFFKRGETVDSEFIFIDNLTNQAINVLDPQYKIIHYNGPLEDIDVPVTPLNAVAGETGVYVVNWVIPGAALTNETYFVLAQGTHPTQMTTTLLEDFFRVVADDYFGGGSGSGTGLVAKFTKP